MYFGVVKKAFLSELTLLSASSLRLLTALYARALIMLTLAELGKHTSLCTGTLESSQSAVQRLVFLDMDFRHRFPSLRATHIRTLKSTIYRDDSADFMAD